MALPTVFHMFFAKPRLVLHYPHQTAFYISIGIQNLPINCWFLKFLHIERDDAKALSIRISIYDAKGYDPNDLGSRIIYSDYLSEDSRLLSFNINNIKGHRIDLPASYYWADTMIARVIEQYGSYKVFIVNTKDDLDTNIQLPEGSYILETNINLGGKVAYIPSYFKVNSDEPYINWDKNRTPEKVIIKLKERG